MITEQKIPLPSCSDADLAYIMQDDSMIGARISSGDMLIVRQQTIAEDGDIALALYNGEIRIGRYSRHNGFELLTPENRNYRSIQSCSDCPSFEIIGTAIGFISTLRNPLKEVTA